MKGKAPFILLLLAVLVIGVIVGVMLSGGGDEDRLVPIGDGKGTVDVDPAPSRPVVIDDGEREITDREAASIQAAAERAVPGGVVTDIERSDDPGEAYEVEVVRDGEEVDIALDAGFERVPNQRFSD